MQKRGSDKRAEDPEHICQGVHESFEAKLAKGNNGILGHSETKAALDHLMSRIQERIGQLEEKEDCPGSRYEQPRFEQPLPWPT